MKLKSTNLINGIVKQKSKFYKQKNILTKALIT